ncbi:MAG: TerB family tellurite resistance protein [Byssovorax sp.]
MGLLAWLGLQRGDEYPNLDRLMKEVRRALPDDEAVVIRYIAIVVVLLGKVAWADGRFSEKEESNLRALLAHVDRITPSGVDAVCAMLRGTPPRMSEAETELCFRELKALCDGRERMEVLRLLIHLAVADGAVSDSERNELKSIADELGVTEAELLSVEQEIVASADKPAG